MKHFTKILTAFLFTSFVLSQIVVGGNVTDLITGKPIVGAKVVVEGTSISAITDSVGFYRLTGKLPITWEKSATISVSMSNYQSKTGSAGMYVGMAEPYINVNFSMTHLKDVITKPKLVGIDMNTLVNSSGDPIGPGDLRYYKPGDDEAYTGKASSTYDNGHIKRIRYIENGFVNNRQWQSFYRNGKKQTESTPKNGVIVRTTWSPDGKEKSEMIWKGGEMWDGKSVSWYNNGQKETETIMKNGKFISEKFWDEYGDELEL